MVRRRALAALVGAVLCAAAGVARADLRAGRPASADPLTVYVLTFGPGDHPFFKFGHDAIWIHDARGGDGQGLQLRDLRLLAAGDRRFSPRADDLLAVGVVAAGDARLLRAREPDDRRAGADARPPEVKRGAAGAAGGERAAREPRLQLRLLPRQLLDARARRDRRRHRRGAAGERADAGAAHAARAGAADDGRLLAALRGARHRARARHRPADRSLGRDVHSRRSWRAGWRRSRSPRPRGRGRW